MTILPLVSFTTGIRCSTLKPVSRDTTCHESCFICNRCCVNLTFQSGAKINISDGSCPERIVTVTGPTNSIFKAFTLICKKFEEWCSQFHDIQGGGAGGGGGTARTPITLRLIVPASQCGSLIGKGGSKIKEIREVTGALIQVASEMLPSSTERTVTISGTSEAITQCIYHICCVMLEVRKRHNSHYYNLHSFFFIRH